VLTLYSKSTSRVVHPAAAVSICWGFGVQFLVMLHPCQQY